MRLGMIGFAGLFSGSFWSGFRYQTPQAIEDQLKKQNPSLSNLLNQEEVIQEVKSGSNTKLQQFFANNLFQMIDLITVMPETDVHDRGHKFPFVAAQILNCDSQIILDAFFKPPESNDSDKVKEKQEEDEGLSQNQDFDADNQEGSNLENFLEKGGITNDNAPTIDGDDDQEEDSMNQEKGFQDDDNDEQDFNKFKQEEENDDKGPLLIKDIEDDNKHQEQNEDADKDVEEKQEEELAKETAEGQENNEKVDKQVQGEQEEDTTPKDNIDQTTKEQDNNNEQKDQATLFGDEEEKALPTLQTIQSTTCETHQKYRFQYLVYLFKFLQQRENRPASPTSSLASETTTATNTEQQSTTTTPTAQLQENKIDDENDNELNNVLSGYFAKLVIHFVIKRPKQFFTFLSERPQCLYNMTQHLYSRAIADALMKILVCENHGIEDSGMSLYQEMRKNVIERVLGYIDIKNSANGIQNAVNILAELASRKPCFDIIVQPSLMEPFFAKLFDGIENVDKKTEDGDEDIKKTAVPSIVRDLRRQGIRLVSWLMQQYRNFIVKQASKNEEEQKKEENKEEEGEKDENEDKEDKTNFTDDDQVVIGVQIEEFDKNEEQQQQEQSKNQEQGVEQPQKKEQKNTQEQKQQDGDASTKQEQSQANNEPSPFIQCIYENFDNLIKFLNIKPFEAIDTISGKVMQPFGAIRLSLIQIIVEAVRVNENALNNKIIQSKILTKLLHFFGEYEWNSLLHYKLDLMFLHIINNSESCLELLHSVIEQSHLIEYVLQLAGADMYKLQNSTSREIERGFFPYTLRIMQSLKRQSEKSSYINDHIKAHEQQWNQVWSQKIEPKQKKYAKQLGGVNPNAKKNQNNNQADNLILPSSLSGDDNKKQSDDDDNNNKFSSFDKKRNDDDDDDDQNPENEPEEEIRNKVDMDDDDDQDEDMFGQNSRYSSTSGGNRANMLSQHDSYQRHKDLYVQTHYNDDDDDDDNTFQGWNVEDPQLVLQKETRSKKNKKKKVGSDLNQAFDSKRDDDSNLIRHDQEEQDFPGFEFNSYDYSSGGFSANEFGQFQSGDEFYDAKDSSYDEDSEDVTTKEQQVEPEYNEFNFWKPTPQYDLNQLMSQM